MSNTAFSLDTSTPSIMAVDPRGLAVRKVAYCRKVAGGKAESRVTHQRYNNIAQLVASWDPRISKQAETEPDLKANITTIYSLNSIVVMTDSADAGWLLALANEADTVYSTWDTRKSYRYTQYDILMRPTSVSEQGAETAPKTVERFVYGEGTAQSAENNYCGRIVRHDDTAGSKRIIGYTLNGKPLGESRRFLKDLRIPSWPVELPLRDEQLQEEEYTSNFLYAPTSDLLVQVDALGNRQRHQYNVAGQLTQTYLKLFELHEKAVLSNVCYNASGQVKCETAGNGVISSAHYRPEDGRLISLLSKHPANEVIQNLTYDHDPVGNIIRIADAALTTRHFKNQCITPISTYCYDTLYQLIEARGRESCTPTNGPELPIYQSLPLDPSQMANYVQTYDYDDGGNLMKLVHVGAQQYCRQMTTATNSNRSLPLSDDGYIADFANSFDPNGNLKRLQPGPEMIWNLRNQLHEFTLVHRPNGANDSEWYSYDGGGQRVRKVRTTQAKNVTHIAEVLYLPGVEVRNNTDGNEALHVISVHAGRSTLRVLHWISAPPKDVENDQIRYGLYDQVGSNTLELDERARPLNREGYYPFGGTAWCATRSETEGKYKTIRYSGKERDSSGLYYYGARYYVSWWLRWLNPDPAGSIDGLNFYCMVRNNPITLRDAHGNFSVLDVFTAVAVATAVLLIFGKQMERFIVNSRVRDVGISAIREKDPEFSDQIENGLKRAIELSENTIAILTHGLSNEFSDIQKEILIANYGSIDHAPKLLSDTKLVHADLLDRASNLDTMIATASGSPGVLAYVSPEDPSKKINFTNSAKLISTPDSFAQLILHEQSHVSASTEDNFYLNVNPMSSISNPTITALHHTVLADTIISGKATAQNFEEPAAKKALLIATKKNNLSEAITVFNQNKEIRVNLVRPNADTFAHTVSSLGKMKNSTSNFFLSELRKHRNQ